MFNTLNPYWWAASPVITRTSTIPRIDVGGIYKLSTNAVALSDTTVDYGVNPNLYNQLPCECLVVLTIHADVPEGGEGFPVTVAIPSGTTTLATSSASTTTGTSKVNVVDSQGNNVTGSNVSGGTERLVYINKRTGIIRFMEFTNAAETATT